MMNEDRAMHRRDESGQALVVVALFLVGLLAVLGLVLDGGNLYLQRRALQNAADAGALAGARELALGHTTAQAEIMARNYAQTRNGAQLCDVGFDAEGKEITVVAHTTAQMTFARVVGLDETTVSARASASFSGICTAGKMTLAPIAIKKFTWITETDVTNPSAPLYTIWDDDVEEGPDPESSHNIAGNNRGWLTMYCAGYPVPPECGDAGADLLSEWMLNGYNGEVDLSQVWIRGSSGVKTRPVAITQARIGDILLIPVYMPPAEGEDPIQELHPGKAYYYINDVACFYVKEVISTGNPKGIRGYFLGSCVAAGEPGCESAVKMVFLTE